MRAFFRLAALLLLCAAPAPAQSLTRITLKITWDDGTPLGGQFYIRNAITSATILAVTIPPNGFYQGNVNIPPTGLYSGEFDFVDAAGAPHSIGYTQFGLGQNIAAALTILSNNQIGVVINRSDNTLAGSPMLVPLFTPTLANIDGAAYSDTAGNAWTATPCPAGSSGYTTTHAILSTPDPPLYQKECFGNMSFTFPAVNGTHTVTLKFAELYWTAAGQRLFNVKINGLQVLSNFDVFAAAGGQYIAFDESFPVNVTNGQVTVIFTNGTKDNAKIDAIAVQ